MALEFGSDAGSLLKVMEILLNPQSICLLWIRMNNPQKERDLNNTEEDVNFKIWNVSWKIEPEVANYNSSLFKNLMWQRLLKIGYTEVNGFQQFLHGHLSPMNSSVGYFSPVVNFSPRCLLLEEQFNCGVYNHKHVYCLHLSFPVWYLRYQLKSDNCQTYI